MGISIDGVRDEQSAVWKVWIVALSIAVAAGAAGAWALLAYLDQRHPVIPSNSVVTLGAGVLLDDGIAAVTGTGPDLVQVADRSKAIGHVTISGTGPDLAEVASYGP